MELPSVRRLTSARIPTVDGEFELTLYENTEDDKDHLALVCGDVEGHDDVLVRVHSECFTGDVLGSLRCDCGEQLDTSMRRVAEAGQGIILYLRQEGRGIGLVSKLRAYNLQDEGYDTVEANRLLGHGADERDYTIAATLLREFGVSSVRLLTNNPEKIESLEEYGIDVVERVPLEPHVNRHNADYLRTKVERMRHILDLGPVNGRTPGNSHASTLQSLRQRTERYFSETGRPFVTLSYAQSLDGSIASRSGNPMRISGEEALTFTHRLRALHDGILVGIGTVLADDPRLNVRLSSGPHPVPVILDSSLRLPVDAQLFEREGPSPIVVSSPEVDCERRATLESRGATVVPLRRDSDGRVSLESLLDELGTRGISSLMVEGGTEVLTSFLRSRHVQRMILTVSPVFVGGTPALSAPPTPQIGDDSEVDRGVFPELTNVQQRWCGRDLVIEGDPVWNEIDE